MISRHILSMVFMAAVSLNGMAQMEIHRFFKCTDYKTDGPGKETTKKAVFHFNGDSILCRVEIYPCYTATNVNYGNLIVEGNDIPVLGKYSRDLKVLLSKYTEYIRTARENNIEKYRKNLDELVSNSPSYDGYFRMGENGGEDYRFVRKIRMTHQFNVYDKNTICIEIVTSNTKGIKVKGTSDHDFFYDTHATNPMTYLSFTTPEQLRSFMEAVDIDEAVRELKHPNHKYRDKDELFR